MTFSDEYLNEAADNIIDGLLALKDTNDNSLLGMVQKFIFPYPSTDSWACVHTYGATVNVDPSKDYQHSQQDWTVPIRIGVGSIEEGYLGRQQERLFIILPQVVNMFVTHPDLTFITGHTKPTYYANSWVEFGAIRSGTENLNERGRVIFIDIPIRITFNVQIQVKKHKPNGEEYIV